MNSENNIYAFLAYLLLVPGWLFALLFRRQDDYTQFHARQSLTLNVMAVLLLVVWFVFAWIASWVPVVGPPFAGFLFAIVIGGYIFLVIAWITGMVRALRWNRKPLFLVGAWAQKLPF